MESTQLLAEDHLILAGSASGVAPAEPRVVRDGAAESGAATAIPAHGPDQRRAILDSLPAARRSRAYAITKRGMDLGFCLIALPMLALLLVAVAIAIRVDSRGPILLRQVRIGRGGRPFTMYKFRTLHADYNPGRSVAYMQAFVRGEIGGDHLPLSAEINKPVTPADMTRIGKFLRHTSLDELPQILNVVKGEMSLVGPRPNVEWEVAAYSDWHRERLDAVPGITGLAQIRGRSWASFDRIVAADIEYARRQSVRLDLYILWMTVRCVFSSNGAG